MALTDEQWKYLERDWAEGGDPIKDRIDEKELAWTAIELKHHVEKLQKLWRDSHGVAVEQIPPEYVNAIFENIKSKKQIEELEKELRKKNEPLRRGHIKPGHGPCCTCQRCGKHYDDCRCDLDDLDDEIDVANTTISKLEKIIEKLPKTKDGVSIVPGMNLWTPNDIIAVCPVRVGVVSISENNDTDDFEILLVRDEEGKEWYEHADNCFSTSEAVFLANK